MDESKIIEAFDEAKQEVWTDDDQYTVGYNNGLEAGKNIALTLLKEQEAVKPLFKQDEKGIFVWCCGSCGAYMYHIYDRIDKAKEYAKFCRQCGRSVKWE